MKLGEVTLTERTDYVVSYSDDLVNIGTVTVTVTGTGNYTGKAKGSYNITPVDITQKGSISEIAEQTYTGTAITPDVRVTLGDTVLTAGTDYTISYANNVNAGIAAVTVEGQGNYKGTLIGKFVIKPFDPPQIIHLGIAFREDILPVTRKFIDYLSNSKDLFEYMEGQSCM